MQARFPGEDAAKVTRRGKDLSSQASYFRREGDWFSFAHKSFLEYFVARRVAVELRAQRKSEIPLTDVIVAFHASADDISHRPGWARISAVQRGAVITDLSPDDLVRPSPRWIDGLEKLSQRLDSMDKP